MIEIKNELGKFGLPINKESYIREAVDFEVVFKNPEATWDNFEVAMKGFKGNVKLFKPLKFSRITYKTTSDMVREMYDQASKSYTFKTKEDVAYALEEVVDFWSRDFDDVFGEELKDFVKLFNSALNAIDYVLKTNFSRKYFVDIEDYAESGYDPDYDPPKLNQSLLNRINATKSGSKERESLIWDIKEFEEADELVSDLVKLSNKKSKIVQHLDRYGTSRDADMIEIIYDAAEYEDSHHPNPYWEALYRKNTVTIKDFKALEDWIQGLKDALKWLEKAKIVSPANAHHGLRRLPNAAPNDVEYY